MNVVHYGDFRLVLLCLRTTPHFTYFMSFSHAQQQAVSKPSSCQSGHLLSEAGAHRIFEWADPYFRSGLVDLCENHKQTWRSEKTYPYVKKLQDVSFRQLDVEIQYKATLKNFQCVNAHSVTQSCLSGKQFSEPNVVRLWKASGLPVQGVFEPSIVAVAFQPDGTPTPVKKQHQAIATCKASFFNSYCSCTSRRKRVWFKSSDVTLGRLEVKKI